MTATRLLAALPFLLLLAPASAPAQGAGYGEHGLQRNIPQERAREAYKVDKARGERKLELLREHGHPRHRRPRQEGGQQGDEPRRR